MEAPTSDLLNTEMLNMAQSGAEGRKEKPVPQSLAQGDDVAVEILPHYNHPGQKLLAPSKKEEAPAAAKLIP